MYKTIFQFYLFAHTIVHSAHEYFKYIPFVSTQIFDPFSSFQMTSPFPDERQQNSIQGKHFEKKKRKNEKKLSKEHSALSASLSLFFFLLLLMFKSGAAVVPLSFHCKKIEMEISTCHKISERCWNAFTHCLRQWALYEKSVEYKLISSVKMNFISSNA